MSSTTKWIYFLNYEQDKLPAHFFRLSQELSTLGIMLLPIKPEQVNLFLKEGLSPHIVTITSNQMEQMSFKRAMTKMHFLIMNKKINLYHISSFGSYAFEQKRISHYHYMKLPCKVNLLALRLASFYEEKKPASQVWPGGKRAKLPA